MRKIIFIIIFFSLTVVSVAQSKFGIGVNFSGNSTWLINPESYSSSNIGDTKVKASWGMSYGLIFEYNLLKILGLEVDFNYNIINQRYASDIELRSETNEVLGTFKSYNIIKYNTFDIPLLVKFGNLVYIEGGPLFQFINKSVSVYDLTDAEDVLPEGSVLKIEKDVKKDFKNAGIGASLGFGVNIPIIPNKLRLNAGLRFNYIFTDMVGVNNIGLTKEELEVAYPEKAKEFRTNPLYGGIKVGLVYKF